MSSVPRIFHSVLDAAGPQALAIEHLWWLMFWTVTAVFAIVLGVFAAALVRGGRRASGADETSAASLNTAVSGAVTLTVVILFVLLVASVRTGNAVASAPDVGGAVTIEVVGHQWWWEVTYDDVLPARRVTLANEIHVPVGRPVALKVTSHDVIHSFWAPNLMGKRDLIPGYITAIWLQADREGTFRGQCAEFCGRQHALMAFHVVAEENAAFESWLNGQRQPAVEPGAGDAGRGKELFMASRCSACHAVRGTTAGGLVGPDLTHVGSRVSLGAGILPNTRDHLVQWIGDPQAPKPGNKMPVNPMAEADLAALAAYMQSLR